MGDEHAFTDVDAQPDPSAWVRVLDTLGRDPQYAVYKRRMLDLLRPAAGGAYLQVGVGTGADAVATAERFDVRVVGVDASAVMIDEARRRGLREAVVADAHALPFDDESFDGAWADRTFQHLADPRAALRELVRVLRPGGRLVVADPDYATQVVSIPDQDLARRVLRFRQDVGVRHGTLAHQMGRLFREAGIADLHVEAVPVVLRDPTALDQALGLRDWARFAHEHELIERHEVGAWEASLDAAAAGGHFLYAFSLFITAGQKR